MIKIHINDKGRKYVIASELHSKLGIKTPLRKWFPRMLEYDFEENKDYFISDILVRNKSRGRKSIEWLLTLDMAKEIAMIQRTPEGKAIRKYLKDLGNRVETGKMITKEQSRALIEISQVLGYFSVQKFVEQEHFKVFEGNENWWSYRAKLFGYTTKELKDKVKAIGKRYKNQRQALMLLDKKQLILQASIDLFKAMGKSDEYAKNMTEFVMDYVKLKEPDIYNDIGMSIDFKSVEQKTTIFKIQNHSTNSLLLNEFH